MTDDRSTKRQRELLNFVDTFIQGHGYGPSYREIMRALGYKSVSTVAIHINGLIEKGYVRKSDNSARSLEVITVNPAIQKKTVTLAQEKWLTNLIDERLEKIDTSGAPDKLISELNTLINTLGIIGLDELRDSFQHKLSSKLKSN